VAVTFSGVDTGTQNPSLNLRLTDKSVFIIPTLASGNNPTTTTVKLDVVKGLISGSFVVTDDIDPGPGENLARRSSKIYGVVVQDATTTSGNAHGYFTLPQLPGASGSPILDGRFTASPIP
jgi:hypothetical protein